MKSLAAFKLEECTTSDCLSVLMHHHHYYMFGILEEEKAKVLNVLEIQVNNLERKKKLLIRRLIQISLN
jgi:hypothetical protein